MRRAVWLIIMIGSLLVVCSANAQEVTTGATFQGSEYTHAAHWELTGYSDTRRWRYGISYTQSQVVDNGAKVCGSLGSAGPICYLRDLRVDDYWSAYIQRMWTTGWGGYVGLGLAVHPERAPLLSSEATFRTTLGYRFDYHWSVEWTHMSNAGLRGANHGQDLLLIRYQW